MSAFPFNYRILNPVYPSHQKLQLQATQTNRSHGNQTPPHPYHEAEEEADLGHVGDR